MASYVSPKLRDKFESLSIDLKNEQNWGSSLQFHSEVL